ncbi:hypothetical protein EON64_05925 [archaeon]|nr:MAG: hypothetical protein EON64_05925 [archaeon]
MEGPVESASSSSVGEQSCEGSAYASYLDRVRNKLKCTFCCRSIGRGFYTECATCSNFYLCLDCFSADVRLPPHEPTHPYRIAENLDVMLFTKDWTIKDELMLLDCIEKHGMGNWKVISEMLENNRTAKQVEDHYWELYMGVHGYCLPASFLQGGEVHSTLDHYPAPTPDDRDLPPVQFSSLETGEVLRVLEEQEKHYVCAYADDPYRIPLNPPHTRGEQVHRDTAQRKEGKQEVQSKLASLVGAELPGYMPLREDFDVEYENDAEQVGQIAYCRILCLIYLLHSLPHQSIFCNNITPLNIYLYMCTGAGEHGGECGRAPRRNRPQAAAHAHLQQ